MRFHTRCVRVQAIAIDVKNAYFSHVCLRMHVSTCMSPHVCSSSCASPFVLRYELHEWLSAIHTTLEEFKKNREALTVGTQTGVDSEYEEQTRDMRLSSLSGPPSSESDRHSEGIPNGNLQSDGEGRLDAMYTPVRKKSWDNSFLESTGENGRRDQEERRPPRRRRSRSLPHGSNRNSRNLSPPRDPPPPPPSDLHMSRDHLPNTSDDEGHNRDVINAVNEAFSSLDDDRNGLRDRGATFSTFKPKSLSQPTFNTWHRGTSTSEGRRSTIASDSSPKRVPVATAIPLPHLGNPEPIHKEILRKTPSVYDEEFVENHPSVTYTHRRKMSAPAEILLRDPPILPPRKKSSGNLSNGIEHPASSPPREPPQPRDPTPPPIPPHEPIKPTKPTSAAFSERQPSLRQMTSKNFLSHLTAVTPYKKPSEPLEDHLPPTPEQDQLPTSPHYGDTESDSNEDEFTKFSVAEIKRRLFGEGSGSPIASKESFKPTLKVKSHGNSSEEEPLRNHTASESTDGPQVQKPMPQIKSRVVENPNYSTQVIKPKHPLPKSASSNFTQPGSTNGYHEQNGHSNDHSISRPPWMASSQTLNDFRLSSAGDRSFYHANQKKPLQSEDRSHSSSMLKMKGKITDLDEELFQRPTSGMPRSGNRYNRGISNPPKGNHPHITSQPKSYPHVTSLPRTRPHATPTFETPQASTYRDPKRAPRRNRPPVQDRPGRTTPNGVRRASVFDTTVEWDEGANQTILRSLC